MTFAEEDNFIPGIYNYCDRWCERCEFTARCRVFATELEIRDEEKDPSNEAFVVNIRNSFAEAKRLLEEKAEEFGFDLTPMPDAEFQEIQERTDAFIDGQELNALARDYGFEAKDVLDAQNEWMVFAYGDEQTISDILEVIYWYQFFIAAKVHRGLHGIVDTDGYEDAEQLDDPQSEANGSIKVALIGIERSILAWTYLLAEGNADLLRPLIEKLHLIGRLAEQKFPLARGFIRPGFDEIETVM